MTTPIIIPSVGESVSEVTIASWVKKNGDQVKLDEIVCEIESDKASVELTSPAAGVLKILIQEGEVVKIGANVAQVEESATSTKSEVKSTPTSSIEVASQPIPPIASIAAKKILDEANVPLEKLKDQGSGKNGRITKEDAINATKVIPTSIASVAAPVAAPITSSSVPHSVQRTKMSSLRKTIAKRLVDVKNTTAMLTTFQELDCTQLKAVRANYKDIFKEKHEVGLGFMSFFTKAACLALKEIPGINSQIDGEDIISFSHMDIGIAVSTPKGLVVPILRNAQNMSMSTIEKSIVELAKKGRDGKLSINEMTGGTFTITNGGIFGSMLSTPILNAPQSAILGLHNIVDRAVVKNNQIVIAPIMYLALSYDHRIVDGKESVTFLKTIKEFLEDPIRLLLES